MPKEQKYKERNIVRAVLNNDWLIEPSKLDEIVAFLELRASGGIVDHQQIQFVMQVDEPIGIERFFSENEDGITERVDVNGIRLLRLQGTMAPKANLMMRFSGGTSTENLARDFLRAGADENVSQILFLVDSPGGLATGTAELANVVFDIAQKKPVITFAQNMMASAAFWVGTAGTRAIASPSAEIGSVGTFAVMREITEAAAMAGVKFEVFRAGPLKGAGSEFEKLSPERRASIQARLDGTNRQFVQGLMRNFGISETEVLESFGGGTVFRAPEALARGMIDQIASLESTIDQLIATSASRQSFSSTGGIAAMNVSPKIKAALFAGDFITSLEAIDETCLAVLRSLARAKGQKIEDATEAELLQLIQGREKLVKPKPTVNEDMADIIAVTISNRRDDILAVGETLDIPKEWIAEALTDDSDKTLDDIRKEWVAKLAEDPERGRSVAAVSSGATRDKLESGLTYALLERAGQYDLLRSDETLQRGYPYSAEFRGRSLMAIAERTLEACGIRATGNQHRDAVAFLRLGMEQCRDESSAAQFETNALGITSMEDSTNRRGDHPDALSNLMGRMLDQGYAQAETTYPTFSRQFPDVPDFRPKSIIDVGVFHELDLLEEDEEHKQLKFESELRAWFQAVKYGNKVGLTVEMVIDDDIGLFGSQLATLAFAAEKRLDNTCRALLASNPVMVDGNALFSVAHNNLVAAGGVPSAASAAEMRRLQRLIKGFGSDRTMNESIRKVYVPAAHEEVALQTFMSLQILPEVKRPATDATVNTVRGLWDLTIDSELDGLNADAWYTFARDGLLPIGYSFLRGFGGARGQRKTWVNPDNGTRYAAIDFAAATAVVQFRGAIKNPGV